MANCGLDSLAKIADLIANCQSEIEDFVGVAGLGGF
jgi:hypothetical protein